MSVVPIPHRVNLPGTDYHGQIVYPVTQITGTSTAVLCRRVVMTRKDGEPSSTVYLEALPPVYFLESVLERIEPEQNQTHSPIGGPDGPKGVE